MSRTPEILICYAGRRVNENQLAAEVCQLEGLCKQTDIGQAKEVIRHTLAVLARIAAVDPCAVLHTLERHRCGKRARK
jgi:hypothetical protein